MAAQRHLWYRRVLILVLTAVLGGTVWSSGAAVSAPGQPVRGGVLHYATQARVITVSPISSAGANTFNMVANLYNRLTAYDEAGRLVGSLASSWTTVDRQTYLFHLVKGIKFHNGDPFTAEDVLYTLRLIQDPSSSATDAGVAQEIASMSTPDPYTVKIVLTHRNVIFPNELAFPDIGIVDHQWHGDLKTQENGTGPFYLAASEPTGTHVVKRFTDYWERGKPYLDEIDYIPIIDDQARVNALLTGQVDFAEYIQWNYYPVVTRNPNLQLFPGPYDYLNMIHLNVHQAPLTDARIRQALNYAVDRQQISRAAFGGLAKLITGDILPKDSPYHSASLEGTYTYDPAKARTLLAAAGMKPGDLHLVLTTITYHTHYDTAQIVQQQLTQFGAQITLKIQTVQELVKNWYKADYQMMMDGQALPWGDPSVLSRYFALGGTYDSAGIGYDNPQIGRLLTDGLGQPVLSRRKAVYEHASRLVLQDAPWIFLNFRVQGEGSSKHVHGYVHLPSGFGATFSMGRLQDVWLDNAGR